MRAARASLQTEKEGQKASQAGYVGSQLRWRETATVIDAGKLGGKLLIPTKRISADHFSTFSSFQILASLAQHAVDCVEKMVGHYFDLPLPLFAFILLPFLPLGVNRHFGKLRFPFKRVRENDLSSTCLARREWLQGA